MNARTYISLIGLGLAGHSNLVSREVHVVDVIHSGVISRPTYHGKKTVEPSGIFEGMVCKRKASVCAEHGWLKVRNPHYTQMEGRH